MSDANSCEHVLQNIHTLTSASHQYSINYKNAEIFAPPSSHVAVTWRSGVRARHSSTANLTTLPNFGSMLSIMRMLPVLPNIDTVYRLQLVVQLLQSFILNNLLTGNIPQHLASKFTNILWWFHGIQKFVVLGVRPVSWYVKLLLALSILDLNSWLFFFHIQLKHI